MRLVLAAVTLSLVAGCAQGPDPRKRPLAANPSAYVAAEIAFARLAQEKGQWTAFRETSAPDAVMFVPQRVKARDWLKAQANPAEAVKWQPHAVYVSCDGNAGATTGAWQKGGGNGYFTTVWLRDPISGKINWVLDHGDALTAPRAAPDFIETKQAKCGSRPAVPIEAGDEGDDMAVGLSPDQTLSWTSTVHPDQSRRLVIRLWDGKTMATVIDDKVAAPPK
ncbi:MULTISPECIES: hypothetical protein [unclassified Sphingopyxis]|uniref:hypothetical protein n=1 Tax=unclassified Sphingopyxis TaxID=2614943 RepID=UPI0007311C1E|nr:MULTISPECIES: hypothetical protein [unclassified Sphingopyxis]KTE23582.1 hypothetical protein ATE61_16695 [Sphingopyxis sp. H057]KTE50006.1 hypothetical protein ATE64_17940 [Sphingopyxis sp. H073]KTE53174.1 hypothetical protein ATE69_12680 [Sphingopyxis sp. H071]KTE59479.1 hypothetical protein ATE66_11040 [Sphingopyxis sp. H107]KTE63501.1 hypothetical protein ATE65_15150 [Sphingopyxis sp. H100]